jgi:alkylresorcinol/alkylpyrone synthase
LEESFGLQQGSLTLSRQVLHDYGNMSAASIFFVLEAAMVQGLEGRQLLSALGPGFTAAFLVLEAEGSLPPRALNRPKAAE